MSAKPTPGPHFVIARTCSDGHKEAMVCRDPVGDHPLTTFPDAYCDEREQAEANARAWVEGIASMEKLEKIRDICWNLNEPTSRLAEISELVRAKP